METECVNPKLTQKQLAEELGYSDLTLKGYGIDIKIQNPYKSKYPKRTQLTSTLMIETSFKCRLP